MSEMEKPELDPVEETLDKSAAETDSPQLEQNESPDQTDETRAPEERDSAAAEDSSKDRGVPSMQSLVAVHDDGRDRVEALIFAAEEALNETQIAEILGFQAESVLDCIRKLNEEYTDQGRSFLLKRLAGGYQLVSRSRYGDDIRRLLKVQIRHRLSRAALETLAVIAYKQPITKSEVESLRGVASDGVLRTLLDRHLVLITGRSKNVGKPLLYGTTREFLEYFGLEDLKDMPRLKEIKELMKGRDSGEENLPEMPVSELLPGTDPAIAEEAAGENRLASDSGLSESRDSDEEPKSVDDMGDPVSAPEMDTEDVRDLPSGAEAEQSKRVTPTESEDDPEEERSPGAY